VWYGRAVREHSEPQSRSQRRAAREQQPALLGASPTERLIALQRSAGNRAVAQLLARQPTPTADTVAPLDEAGLRSAADTYINAEYASAAHDALNDVMDMISSSMDWGSFLVALAGNLIWAAACFTTTGVFGVSVAGILVNAAAPGASTPNIDRGAFRKGATALIDGLVTQLLGNISGAAHETAAEVAAHHLSDADARHHLLLHLLKPEFIQQRGGLWFVDRPAIQKRIRADLLLLANAHATPWGGGGRFKYDYMVANHFKDTGWIFTHNKLQPVDQWQFGRTRVHAYVPAGGKDGFEAIVKADDVIWPGRLPWLKTIYLTSLGASGHMEIYLDGNNDIERVDVSGIFEDFGKRPSRPRGFPEPPDLEGQARKLLDRLWMMNGGKPEPIPSVELGYDWAPGRSFATR
jgi:hypothetical protein